MTNSKMSTTVEIKSKREGYCRICQCYEDENMFDMLQGFKKVMKNENKLQSTCESFTRMTGIKVSSEDESLRFVCGDCFTCLNNFLLLRQQAKDSHRKLTETTEFQSSGSIENNSGQIIKWEKEESQPQCLICMGYNDEMSDIFSDTTFELDVDYVEKLSHIFEEIVGISPSDYYRGDKLLCGECVNRVKRSSFLRYQASKSDANIMEDIFAQDMVEIKQENLNCQICLMEFVDQPEYEAHLPCSNQTKSDKSYKCPICQKSFSHNYPLKSHMVAHSNSRLHMCKICSKAFKYQNSLNYHLRAHSNDRPYACKLCSKTFKRSDALAKHVRTHNTENLFLCKICSRTFKYQTNLTTHLRTHSSERKYICTTCTKSFKQSSSLSQHLRIHSNDRPFSCNICLKTFKRSSTLHKHQTTHKNVVS